MKTVVLTLSLLLLSVSWASADRVHNAVKSVESFRPVGNTRIWTFVASDTTVGRLVSTVSEKTKIGSVPALSIKEEYTLDFGLRGYGQKMMVSSEHFVSQSGAYLGDRMNLTNGEQTERFELMRDGDQLGGFVTRGGTESELEIELSQTAFGIDNNFLDQYEMFLALLEFTVGDTIVAEVFQPQSLVKARVEAVVEEFLYKELWKNRFDSVFIIHFSWPQEMFMLFTPDNRLVRYDLISQGLRAYQDVVSTSVPAKKQAASIDFKKYVRLIPFYIAYLVLTSLVLLFLTGRQMKLQLTWFALAGGGVLYWLMPYTQIPLQMTLVRDLLLPNVRAGGSIYVWAIAPALAVGLFQEVVRGIAIFAFANIGQVKERYYSLLGAACGAGFGLMEACYIAGKVQTGSLFSLGMLERFIFILFHALAGSLVGHALRIDPKRAAITVGILAVVHSFLRYLPTFVQQQALPANLMHIIVAMIILGLLVVSLKLTRSDSVQ